jgi:hypothetical protein
MTIETLQFKSNPTAAEQKLQDQWLTGKKINAAKIKIRT